MDKAKKTKLSTLLIIGPAILTVGAFLLALVLSSLATSLTPPSDPNSELFGEDPFLVKLLKIVVFIMGALGVIGMIAIIPCLIIGLIVLAKRMRG